LGEFIYYQPRDRKSMFLRERRSAGGCSTSAAFLSELHDKRPWGLGWGEPPVRPVFDHMGYGEAGGTMANRNSPFESAAVRLFDVYVDVPVRQQ
jgi:hypothetical protein